MEHVTVQKRLLIVVWIALAHWVLLVPTVLV